LRKPALLFAETPVSPPPLIPAAGQMLGVRGSPQPRRVPRLRRFVSAVRIHGRYRARRWRSSSACRSSSAEDTAARSSAVAPNPKYCREFLDSLTRSRGHGTTWHPALPSGAKRSLGPRKVSVREEILTIIDGIRRPNGAPSSTPCCPSTSG
jgi:hypothetical protein